MHACMCVDVCDFAHTGDDMNDEQQQEFLTTMIAFDNARDDARVAFDNACASFRTNASASNFARVEDAMVTLQIVRNARDEYTSNIRTRLRTQMCAMFEAYNSMRFDRLCVFDEIARAHETYMDARREYEAIVEIM